jgi:hypothetical protein
MIIGGVLGGAAGGGGGFPQDTDIFIRVIQRSRCQRFPAQ